MLSFERYRGYARATLRKDRRVNIRISSLDDYRTDIDFETEEMIGGVVYKVMSAGGSSAVLSG